MKNKHLIKLLQQLPENAQVGMQVEIAGKMYVLDIDKLEHVEREDNSILENDVIVLMPKLENQTSKFKGE